MKTTPGQALRISTGATLLLGLASLSPAAEAVPRCAGIIDDAQRLACYDAQFGKPAQPVAAKSLPAPRVSAPQPEPKTVPEPQPRPEPKPREEIVNARITAVSRISNGRFRVTLDNGQEWTQLERDPSAEVQIGDAVRVRPAMMGSWMLETRGGVRTRVRSTP